MPWLLLGLHIAAVIGLAFGGNFSHKILAPIAALPPALTAVWAAVRLVRRSDSDEPFEPQVVEFDWVEGLDLGIRFRIDSLALLMTLLVSGIGAFVFVYAGGYFSAGAANVSRLLASLVAFSFSMLGLVWADSIWTLFIFWEFTSVTSFLLVGHKTGDPVAQAAARRALMITGGGGLALLVGLMVMADDSGTFILTDLEPLEGTAAAIASALVVIGAATKSAQVPFHVWLPGAMVAPTPVSSYLHSATMVKAGVLLMAVTQPALGDVDTFKVLGMGLGVSTIIWGAIGALRHTDAKLILAWGTVSQLGLMVTLFSIGSAKAIFAGVSILFAHALFKAALFFVVGEIDVRTGTREISELGGLTRKMPASFAVASVAALSMAGIPPMLGFAAKEAAVEAVIKLDGLELVIASIGVIGGSVLTVAYSLRFLIGVFGPGPDTKVGPLRPAMIIPAAILGAASFVGFVALDVVNDIVKPAAIELNAKADVYSLHRWPGITTAFVISMLIVAGGTVVGLATSRLAFPIPKPVGAGLADSMLDGTLRIARYVTARVQHGSLPVYLVIMAEVVIIAAIPFLGGLETDHLVWADNPLQMILAIAVAGSAIAGAFVGSRLGAALTLGGVGVAMSGLFVIHGAPDLALTQLLVETIIVVGFVIGLGHLAHRFPKASSGWVATRLAVAAAGGVVVVAGLVAASANPTGSAPLEELTTGAVETGGGNNVVNVILTDLRALDTLGEVVVLATVAIGIVALGKLSSKETQR